MNLSWSASRALVWISEDENEVSHFSVNAGLDENEDEGEIFYLEVESDICLLKGG